MDGVPRLFLIDSFGFIFRAYHARARTGAPPMRTAAGVQTEAVYIFHNMVKRLQSVHKPEYLVAIFESLGPTFRDAAAIERMYADIEALFVHIARRGCRGRTLGAFTDAWRKATFKAV